MTKDSLPREEQLLASLYDRWEKVKNSWEPAPEVLRVIQETWKIEKDMAKVKKEAKGKRVNLKTWVAVTEVKKAKIIEIQKEQMLFELQRDKMFKLTNSSPEFETMFWLKLDKDQQRKVIKYFFDWIEENWLTEVAEEKREPTIQELRLMKYLKGYLYMYYEWINERLVFLKWDKLPFIWNAYPIAEIWANIESVLTKYWTMFSKEWLKIDWALERKTIELSKKWQ